jgi:hypothetical protein
MRMIGRNISCLEREWVGTWKVMLGEVKFEEEKVSIAVREGRGETCGVRKDGALRKSKSRAVQCRCGWGWMDRREGKAWQLRGRKPFRVRSTKRQSTNGIAGWQAPAEAKLQYGTGFCCSNQGSPH